MHREIADLKLQLQMARLERGSGDDLRSELAKAKEEIAHLKAEREKLKESFAHFDGDKKAYRTQLENEVAELKLRSLRELKDQRDEDQRKFENWKSETASHLTNATKSLVEQRAKLWNQRPFTREMVSELSTETSSLIRKALGTPSTQKATPPPVPAQTSSHLKIPIGLQERRKKPRQSHDGPWQRISVGAFIVAAFLAVAWYASIYLKRDHARTMASTAVESARPSVPQAAPVPAKTAAFKRNYVENVLSTTNYVDAELNIDFRTLWLKEFAKAARDWKLDKKTISEIGDKEIVLIQDLNRMQANPAAMQQREEQFIKELQAALGKKASVDKFMRLNELSTLAIRFTSREKPAKLRTMKVLIMRFSSFGDVLQTLSVAGRLAEAYPQAEIHWVTRAEFVPLIRLHPQVKTVWSVEKGAGLKDLYALSCRLRAQKFTHIYDAHNNLRSHLLSLMLNGVGGWRVWTGQHKFLRRSIYRFKRFLLFRFHKNLFPKPFSGQFALLEPLKAWGLEPQAPKPPQLFLDPLLDQKVKALLPAEYVALAPSAAFALKRWPMEHWKTLIAHFDKTKFVVLGGRKTSF